MSWSFEPKTFVLTHPDKRTDYTAAELARQEWPPCPVCGTRVHVGRVSTRNLNNRDSFMPGRVECPRGCDPRA